MKTRDLADLAFRNLREAILRNALTTLEWRSEWLRWWR